MDHGEMEVSQTTKRIIPKENSPDLFKSREVSAGKPSGVMVVIM